MSEQWRNCFYNMYAVSNLGRVKRVAAGRGAVVGRILKIQRHKSGYYFVWLVRNGKYYQRFLAALVAKKFIGPCPPDKEMNHKDRDKANNKQSNLEYLTHLENVRHGLANGVTHARRGKNNGNAKLTHRDTQTIQELWRLGQLGYKPGRYNNKSWLGRRFGVSHTQIKNIVEGRTWHDRFLA
jgi:hypothetical protein